MLPFQVLETAIYILATDPNNIIYNIIYIYIPHSIYLCTLLGILYIGSELCYGRCQVLILVEWNQCLCLFLHICLFPTDIECAYGDSIMLLTLSKDRVIMQPSEDIWQRWRLSW